MSLSYQELMAQVEANNRAADVWISLRAYEPVQGKQSVIYSRNGDFVVGQHDRNVLTSVELPKRKPKWTLAEVQSAVNQYNCTQEAARGTASQLALMGVPV